MKSLNKTNNTRKKYMHLDILEPRKIIRPMDKGFLNTCIKKYPLLVTQAIRDS